MCDCLDYQYIDLNTVHVIQKSRRLQRTLVVGYWWNGLRTHSVVDRRALARCSLVRDAAVLIEQHNLVILAALHALRVRAEYVIDSAYNPASGSVFRRSA